MGGKKAAEEEPEEKKGGCLGKLVVLFVLLLLGGFATALFFVAEAQDTSDIRGYGGIVQAGEQRDLKKVLENSIQRGHPVTLTEEEINRYIKKTLSARQAGYLSSWVEIKGVAVRTEDGRLEVVIERAIQGRPFTVSMYVSIGKEESPNGVVTHLVNQHGGPMVGRLSQPMAGGRFGRVVVPQGFLLLVLDSFKRIAAIYEEELLSLKEMDEIRISRHGVLLDPRTSSDGVIGTR